MPGSARSVPAALVAAALLLSGCTLGGAGQAERTADVEQVEGTEQGEGTDQAQGSEVVTLRPGLPGEPNRVVDPDAVEADVAPASPFSDADVAFLRDMRVHHEQALAMTALVEGRTDREDVLLFVRRMDISQTAELEQLERMLTQHEEAVRAAGAGPTHGGHSGHSGHEEHDEEGGHDGHSTPGAHHAMPGMLSEQDLAALEAATGDAFVRLFLEGMTRHHEGAIVMVEELLAVDGSAADPRLFRFANHVDSDQRIEIERMARLYAELPPA